MIYFNILQLLLVEVYSGTTIISVVEVFRHGARAPIDNYIWDTGFWNQGFGELTQEGMRQQYLNGVEFQMRYTQLSQVVSPFYNQSEIYVRSTDVNRTIMSAESQLLGFFPTGPSLTKPSMMQKAVPPLNIGDLSPLINNLGMQAIANSYQPVPVHVVNQNFDNMLAGYSPQACPYLNIIIQAVQLSSYYQFLVANYTQFLQKQLYQVFGQMIDFETAGYYADVMVCERFHGFNLPNGITEEMYQQLLAILNYTNGYVFQENGAYLASSQFYSKVLSIFDGVIYQNASLKFGFFSAHDVTLIGFLTAINNWNGMNPPFASSLIFELHQNTTGFFVQTLYNDQVLNVGNCTGLCPYEWFQNYLESWIIEDVPQACQIPPDHVIGKLNYNHFINRLS